MEVLDGKKVSQACRGEIENKVKDLLSQGGKQPGLAVVLVGDDPASQVYVRNKESACKAVGFNSWVHRLPEDSSMEQIKSLIDELNDSSNVHGLLVQLPLPKHLDEDQVISWISPMKDVDGLSIENIGLFTAGRPRVVSCTPNGVMAILKHFNVEISGKSAVVVGRSQIVGIPMARLLQNANATVTVCHSRTPDTSHYTRQADIVVVAAGIPEFLGKYDFKKGAIVVDVGIHRKEGDGKKLCGDVRFEELDGWVKAATPVPGGVGPMTITMLLENTLTLAKIQMGG